MSTTSKFAVVVQLICTADRPLQDANKQFYALHKVDVDTYDGKWLVVTRDDKLETFHKLKFDRVHDLFVPRLEQETQALLDQVLLERQKACLIRFFKSPMVQYEDLLLGNEIETRLSKVNAKVAHIRVECTEICASSKKQHFHEQCNTKVSSHQFENTSDVDNWLKDECRMKFLMAAGHIMLEFNITATKADDKCIYKAKFSMLFIYVDHMDLRACFNLQKYMEKLSGKVVPDFEHFPLTSALSKHLEDKGAVNVSYFEVPDDLQGSPYTLKIIQMAHLMMRNCRRRKCQLHSQKLLAGRAVKVLDNRTALSQLSVDNEQPERKRSRLNELVANLSSSDLHGLIKWYQIIDTHFARAIDSQSKYFGCLNDGKFSKISSAVLAIVEGNDAPINREIRSSFEENRLRIAWMQCAQELRELQNTIISSQFASSLSAYLTFKDFELEQHMVKIQINLLQHAKESLSQEFDHKIAELRRHSGLENA